MSSISLPHEKQIRHFFPASAIATETTAATFISGASNGEIQLFMEQGTTTGAGPDFYILKKHLTTGVVSKSDLITPKDITYIKGTAPRAKVGKTNVFTMTAPVVGATYNLTMVVKYAGSEVNFATFIASTVAQPADTAAHVAVRLAKQLADNLANSVNTSTNIAGTDTINGSTTAKKNKYFTLVVTGTTTATLTITEKDWILDGYVPGLKTYDQLSWNAEVETFTDASKLTVIKTAGTPVYAQGQGYQIHELERYLVGHRLEVALADQTLGFNNKLETSYAAGTLYYVLDLKYHDVSRNDPYQSDKMLTIVSTDAEVIDNIGFRIEALMGASEGDIWTELDPAQDGADNLP